MLGNVTANSHDRAKAVLYSVAELERCLSVTNGIAGLAHVIKNVSRLVQPNNICQMFLALFRLAL